MRHRLTASIAYQSGVEDRHMKKILTGLLAISVTTLSLAANQSKVIYELKHRHDICDAKLDLAEAVMNLRQLDIDLEEMMSDTSDYSQSIVLDAYDQPLYSSQQSIDSAVADFGKKHYLLCLQNDR